MRRVVVALLILAIVPVSSTAQRLGTNRELFSTASLMGDVAQVKAPSGSHIAPFGGFHGDVRLQIDRLGIGAGYRFSEFHPIGPLP